MMKSNLDYFKFSIDNPEQLIDESYISSKEHIVITNSKSNKNLLMKNNQKLIRLISTFQTLIEDLDYDLSTTEVKQTINLIIDILDDNSVNINYTAFCQYFMVQNLSYTIYIRLSKEKKQKTLYDILVKYIKTRHPLYIEHGYSDIILQVLSDNYSHKRKGVYGLTKVTNFLQLRGIEHYSTNDNSEYYLTPDNGDKSIFKRKLKEYNIKFEWSKLRQGKIPDLFVKYKDQIIIMELKNMKESGGGQDKQMSEILDFIKHEEDNPNIHYAVYLDGIYLNDVLSSIEGTKFSNQYNEALNTLEEHESNFFFNTSSFNAFLDDLIEIDN